MITKFHGSGPWRCEDIKEIVAPEIGPKSFGTFEECGAILQKIKNSLLKNEA